MHLIEIDNDRYHLPESWDELTLKQLRYLARLTAKDTPVEEVKIHMMLYCLEAKVCRHSLFYTEKAKISIGQKSDRVRLRIWKKKYLVSPDEVLALSSLFDFLIEEITSKSKKTPPKYAINPDLTTNPLPSFQLRLRKFYGPEDGLYNITYEQFVWLQHYHQAMNHDPEAINSLLAVIYHQGKRFEVNHIERDARILKHLPKDTKMVLYWFYLGSLSWITSMFPRVFSGGNETNGNVYESQLRIIDSLANSDMTKKPAVRNGLLYDALVSMEETVRKQEELEESMRNS